MILGAIESYLKVNGINGLSLQKVYNHIRQSLPDVYPPSIGTLSVIIRSSFCLNFNKFSPANARYKDPRYDEKRLWVSRLLTYMLMNKMVIVSIDESNFRSRMTNGYRWNFDSEVQKRRVRKLLDKQQHQHKGQYDPASNREDLS